MVWFSIQIHTTCSYRATGPVRVPHGPVAGAGCDAGALDDGTREVGDVGAVVDVSPPPQAVPAARPIAIKQEQTMRRVPVNVRFTERT
jgi:hypothetical protein